MARSEARLKIGCWRTGLGGLSAHAKLMYCVLLTEPTLNHAGVGRTCLALWADNASLTMGEAEKALRELCDGRWVLIDETTHEVFVRTLIRNDGTPDQPYLLKGALKQGLLAESPAIRRTLAEELRKLPPRAPDGVSKTGRKIVYPDPHEAADVLDPPPPDPTPTPKATREAPETLFEGVGDAKKGLETQGGRGGGRGGGISSSVGGSVGSAAQRRGTRIPNDFKITQDMVAWARANTPDVDGRYETDQFVDYWASKAGTAATKLDWVRTWQTWMRRAQREAPTRSPHLRSVPAVIPADPTAALEDLRRRGDARAAAALLHTPWIEPSQAPSDPTPPQQWLRDRRVEWIDAHAADILAALAERNTG